MTKNFPFRKPCFNKVRKFGEKQEERKRFGIKSAGPEAAAEPKYI